VEGKWFWKGRWRGEERKAEERRGEDADFRSRAGPQNSTAPLWGPNNDVFRGVGCLSGGIAGHRREVCCFSLGLLPFSSVFLIAKKIVHQVSVFLKIHNCCP
jgi:hypothetical protein